MYRSRDYIRTLPFRKRRPFAQIFPNANPSAVDLLTKTLTFDPKKHITIEKALAHPYLEAYHDPDDEPVAPLPDGPDPEFFEFDLHKDDISREQLQELLYEEIMSFCPVSIT
ncbi:MAP kinase precursor [Suillus subluteus]|nr:MAP kinase precursor [Suillus subluteus]